MNLYDEDHLTEEDYNIAASNGIHRRLAYQRYYTGWDREDAITKPAGNSGKVKSRVKNLQQQANKNGIDIDYAAIYSRMQRGLSDHDIVTMPKGHYGKVDRDYRKYIDKAASNGIKMSTYIGRRNRGWTKERAATEPVQSEFDWRGKREGNRIR